MNNCIDMNEIKKIEYNISQMNATSMTSSKYRNDLLYFLANNAGAGQYICEVGPYKGGLTAQLAYVCKKFEKKLVICEAVQEYADIVKKNLESLGYADIAEIHVVPFVDFIAQNKLPKDTILTIIDANHIYPYALQNFEAFRSVRNNSYAVAFHDFGLRDTDNIMGVERAVRETFLGDAVYHIGESTLFEPCELHTAPAEDKTFFSGSEGALIILSSQAPNVNAVAPAPQEEPWSLSQFTNNTMKNIKQALEHIFKAAPPSAVDFGLASLTDGIFGRFFTLKHDTGVGKAIRETGCWGMDHVQLFKKVVKEGSIVFDVGANIGHHSVCLAQIVGPSGKVFAFEPQLPVFHTLCANAMVNACANIYPFRVVVGEKAGATELPVMDYTQDENFGAMCIENNDQARNRPIPKLSLDDFVDDPLNNIVSVDFIKIDVQTFELFVLQGAQRVLEKYKPHLFIEVSPYWMKLINNYDYREIYALLQNLGYLTFTPTFDQEQNIPDFQLDETSKEIEWDILAVHKDSLFAHELCQTQTQ